MADWREINGTSNELGLPPNPALTGLRIRA